MIKKGQTLCAAWGWDLGDLNLRAGPTTASALGQMASSPVKVEDWNLGGLRLPLVLTAALSCLSSLNKTMPPSSPGLPQE